jgi:DNA mismatch repair protein MutS
MSSAETSPASSPALAEATPMMRQYLEVKARYPDCLLFFRLGDFYEMFFEDAVKGAEALQITLTARSKGDDRVPMCGVPYHAARSYIAKLIDQGFKVAICDQIEDAETPGAEARPAAGGKLFRREVTRVVTPGMVIDDDMLEAREANYLAAVLPLAQGGAFALLDASTGELRAGEATSDAALGAQLSRAAPREVIAPRTLLESPRLQAVASACARPPVLNAVDDSGFEVSRSHAFLKEHFGVRTLDGFGVSSGHALAAAGAALRYLKETQKSAASHVDRVVSYRADSHLVLDARTLANLEVLRTVRDSRRKGSLLEVVDRSVTTMGSRRLADWLSAPLVDLAAIRERHDAVQELFEHGVLREDLAERLKGVADVERCVARLALGAGNARDLKALGASLGALPSLRQALAPCRAARLAACVPALEGLDDLADLLGRAIAEDPPPVLKEGGMFRPGYQPELDELVEISTSARDYLARMEARERSRTGIASLKIRYNRVFGYYIEVTKPNLHLVPADYVRRQTTVGAERFVTEELRQYEEKVLTADDRRCALEFRLFEELRAGVVGRASAIRSAADAIATLDALIAFARVATEFGYARPEVDDSDVIEIKEGRHAVVERMLGGEAFVPNDILLSGSDAQILIITGPNMAGKSTVMRQAALTVLLAQAGSFVPALSARIGRVDRIFTRVGASDDLAKGQSTFMVEMTETASILHNATARSLVLLDEIGRGTSTFDGLSIAWAVAEYLHDKVGARTLFASHYHELVELAREKPRVKNCTTAVKEWGGRVIFLHKLVAGGASRSYGIEVARLAGLPGSVLDRARQVLANLEKAELDEGGRPAFAHTGGPRRDPDQLPLFARESPGRYLAIAEALRSLDLDNTSPLQALEFVADLKSKLPE